MRFLMEKNFIGFFFFTKSQYTAKSQQEKKNKKLYLTNR